MTPAERLTRAADLLDEADRALMIEGVMTTLAALLRKTGRRQEYFAAYIQEHSDAYIPPSTEDALAVADAVLAALDPEAGRG